jgi:hypothetical protein
VELNVNDRIIAKPALNDITAAIDAAPYPAGWYINLEADDGTYIEAFPEDRAFRLHCERKDQRWRSVDTVDAAQLKDILGLYLRRDPSWHRACEWKSEDDGGAPAAGVSSRSEPPAWAIAVFVGILATFFIGFNLLDAISDSWRDALPGSDYFWIGLIFAPMVLLLILALAVKLIAVRKAAQWPSAMGRVTRSAIRARRSKGTSDTVQVYNEPAIAYEFTALGRKWTGQRISLGDDTGGANTEATLQRYPVGTVVKVFYNPKDPKDCVLERDPPAGLGKGCLIGLAALVLFGIVVWYLVSNATSLLGQYLPKGNPPLTVFATCFGLLLLLISITGRRASRIAANWPTVQGRIVVSEVKTVNNAPEGHSRTRYTPAIEYVYQVNGHDYHGRQINYGITTSGSRKSAEKTTALYPIGKVIAVHYDPANPSNATLEHSTGFYWFMLAIAAACFLLAIHTSGLLG